MRKCKRLLINQVTGQQGNRATGKVENRRFSLIEMKCGVLIAWQRMVCDVETKCFSPKNSLSERASAFLYLKKNHS